MTRTLHCNIVRYKYCLLGELIRDFEIAEG